MTIFGWDMSHFDSPGIGGAVSEGIRFITHKAGGDQDDPEIASWWSNVRNLGSGVLLGAYWVQYPDNARANAAKRADEFLARLDATCPGWRDRDAFILQDDCEIWGGNPATAPSRAQIKAFCDRLVARTGGRYRPIVYAPRWAYGDTLTGLGYPLWASSYVTAVGTFQAIYPGDQSSRWGAYSGQTPAILQYSSSATIGGQSTCDANAFRGTLDQLKALVTPTAIQEDDMNQDEPLGGTHARSDLDVGDGLAAGVNIWHQFTFANTWGVPPYEKNSLMDRLVKMVDAFPVMQSQVTALAEGTDGIDLDALAEKVASAVVAKMPDDRDDVTAEEIAEAIRIAVHGPSQT